MPRRSTARSIEDGHVTQYLIRPPSVNQRTVHSSDSDQRILSIVAFVVALTKKNILDLNSAETMILISNFKHFLSIRLERVDKKK